MRAIQSAKSSIHMQMYGLTDPDVIALLTKKQSDGLDVQIFYDKKASSSLPLLAYPVQSSGLMHRKILVIDGYQIFIGTANCTPQSLKMHDNLILGLSSEALADFFQKCILENEEFIIDNQMISAYLLPDFSGTALTELCKRIDRANSSIQIAMFTLTHPTIMKSLIGAKKRGVAISIAIDRYTALGASKKMIEKLQSIGVEILTSQGSQLLHHKWALIDDNTFILGSANWTRSAFEKNQDCLLIFDDLTSKHKKILSQIWKTIAKSTQEK